MSAQIIKPTEIDWERYSSDYPDHANVIPAEFYSERVSQYFDNDEELRGPTLPWSKTYNDVRLRPGELTLWNGINGHGKSLLLNMVMLGLIEQKQRVCIASMEMKPILTMARMTRQACGTNQPSKVFTRAFHNWLSGSLWLYDQVGTVETKRMMAVLRYCNDALLYAGRRQQINHFVIDSFLKCGLAEDDYNGQKRFVDQLSAFAHDTGMHIHLVTHSRKGESESKPPTKWDIRGAAAISDLAENVFVVWRNKAKEAEARKPEPDSKKMDRPDALLDCEKQRNHAWEGRVSLWYHAASMQYLAGSSAKPMQFFEFHREAFDDAE